LEVRIRETLDLLDGIPGGGRAVVEVVVAEIGPEVRAWRSAAQLAAWAGVAPGKNESAGRRRPSRTRKGNQ